MMPNAHRSGARSLTVLLLVALAEPATAQEEEYQPRPRGSVTWASDAAAIVYEHCTTCHRPGQGTPFTLLNYREARLRARLIGMVVADGYMPPSLPVPGVRGYANAAAMSVDERGLLVQWAREGAAKGEEAEAPAPPQLSEGWSLGDPDLVLDAVQGYTLPADAFDVTRNFVFPPVHGADRWIEAVALRPSSGGVLRALLFVDPSGGTATAAPRDLTAVLRSKPTLGFFPVAGLGGEIVETTPWAYPSPFRLQKGSSLLLQVYFQSTGEEAEERPQLGLYAAADPPRQPLVTVSLGTTELELPAGEETEVRSSFELPVATEVVGVTPHAHRLARELHAWATLPDGSREWLLRIDAWDFTWQQPYWLEDPLSLPAGSVLEMRYLYDNTEENENNPNYPPAAVSWGQTLAGEMAGLHLRLLIDPVDREKLGKAYKKYARKLRL